MLNGSPLNSGPLNSLPGGAAEPVYVVRGQSFVWALRVLVGGENLTAQLTGAVTIDREEAAAGIAGFDLFVAPGAPVVPPDWKGRSVTIDYITTSAGNTTEARRFTGQVSRADWNPVTRLLSCECSDQLQQRVEGMTVAAIDALVGGYWSADVFEPIEGRSHWDYALERLSTRPVSLDCAPTGELRVTSWYAGAPHFVFGEGTVAYQTLQLQQSDLSSTTNRIEIELSYRYDRLWQRNQHYTWLVPAGSFCDWRLDAHDLPTIDMVQSAVTGAGFAIVSESYVTAPLSAPDPCGTGSPWINNFDDLVIGTGITGGRRWVQTVTETYTLTLALPAGEVAATQVVQRQGATLQIESTAAVEWTDGDMAGVATAYQDEFDEARRAAVFDVVANQGVTELLAASRETVLSWQVPASMALGIDLIHTLELDCSGVRARGKCRRVVDTFDLASGSAMTAISIAIMRGGGTSDPLIMPARLGATPIDPGEGASIALPTQIGGRLEDPPYDETKLGFSGNWSGGGLGEQYPRRFDLEAPEIPDTVRDELPLTAATLFRVGVPNDLLEM
ncbi:hypothetical protein [Stutzerimonas degradans]|uniref:Uncharacterized protein n=1 Tax=Stutzerimonas degradans TaxID=2968968 RepID=A0A8E2U2G2_9GAMM|nr:hypothetical protein [Stutzerimonas degradans]MCQ4274505.1 hypothetical protein [Stutzerimonas degradans]PNF77936.1 hypothetical protein CXK95_01175 [Stutzerimonas degradans]QPT23331.1 hypothetical protein I6G33_08785 [Stutzerimonas degradans]